MIVKIGPGKSLRGVIYSQILLYRRHKSVEDRRYLGKLFRRVGIVYKGCIFLVTRCKCLILYTDLSIVWVFLAVNATLILKSVIGTILVARGKWAVSLIGSEASQ